MKKEERKMEGSRGGDGERRKKEVHRREEKKGRTNAGRSVPKKKSPFIFFLGQTTGNGFGLCTGSRLDQ